MKTLKRLLKTWDMENLCGGIRSKTCGTETESNIGQLDCGDQLKMDKTSEGASNMSITKDEEEYLELHTRKWERKAKLWRATVAMCACLLVSWFFGYLGLSSVWVLLMAIGAYRVWDGHIVDLVQESIWYEALRYRNRKIHPSGETAEWLNTIINKWWIFASESIFAKMKENLDPLLSGSKPAILQSMELREFSLGQQTPYFSEVEVRDVTTNPESTVPLTKNDNRHLVVKATVQLHCDDFHMVLGMKGMGMDMDLVVIEKLHVSGTMRLSLQLHRDAQFPHVNQLNVTFVETPEVNLGIKVLKAVYLTEVPGVKTWVHNMVTDALTAALVDPEKVVLYTNANASEQTVPSQSSTSNSPAEGILTVNVSWADPNECKQSPAGQFESKKWFLLRLAEQKHVIDPDISSGNWTECESFLVKSPQDETLTVKVKTNNFLYFGNNTLASYEVAVKQVLQRKTMETVLNKKSSSFPSILLKLQYKPLEPIDLESSALVRSQPDGAGDFEPFSRAGALYLCVHGADALSTADSRETPNPFCMVYSNGKKVHTTQVASDTRNPKWESAVEFLVMDYSKTEISFTVWSRDGSKTEDSSFLGMASLKLTSGEMSIVKRGIKISGPHSGVVTVSAAFREAPSLTQSDWKETQVQQVEDIPVQTNRSVESCLVSTAMVLSSVGDQQLWPAASARDGFAANGQDDKVIEMSLMRAKDLVSKDLNGHSDTYCEVKLGDEIKFETQIQLKTLNPQWDENVTLQMPNPSQKITVIVWDCNPVGKNDFLGSVSITADDIQRIDAKKDSGEWMKLNNTDSGELHINFRILRDDKEVRS